MGGNINRFETMVSVETQNIRSCPRFLGDRQQREDDQFAPCVENVDTLPGVK